MKFLAISSSERDKAIDHNYNQVVVSKVERTTAYSITAYKVRKTIMKDTKIYFPVQKTFLKAISSKQRKCNRSSELDSQGWYKDGKKTMSTTKTFRNNRRVSYNSEKSFHDHNDSRKKRCPVKKSTNEFTSHRLLQIPELDGRPLISQERDFTHMSHTITARER